MHLIYKSNFTKTLPQGHVDLFDLKNKNGLCAQVCNYGARLVSFFVPDKQGKFEDIVLGLNTIDDYFSTSEKYLGATIGRYGNRIAKGQFEVNGVKYQLDLNNGTNILHGGDNGFDSVIWDVVKHSNQKLVLCHFSPHLTCGFPGNLKVEMSYELTDDNELKISYEAITDQDTHFNLTHHSYFNLNGEGKRDIKDHLLKLSATRFVPVNSDLIPTGDLLSVNNTPFDFRQEKAMGLHIDDDHDQIIYGGGYDHTFVIDPIEGQAFATIKDPVSKRQMEVFTNEPGVQLYTSNFMDGSVVGKSGKAYMKNGAFCLETQHFPDSPNQDKFKSTLLKTDEVYKSYCTYKMSCF